MSRFPGTFSAFLMPTRFRQTNPTLLIASSMPRRGIGPDQSSWSRSRNPQAMSSSIRQGIRQLVEGHRWIVEQQRTVSLIVAPDYGRRKNPGPPTTYHRGRPDAPRFPTRVTFRDAGALCLERKFLRRAAEEIAPHVKSRLRR